MIILLDHSSGTTFLPSYISTDVILNLPVAILPVAEDASVR